MTDTEITFDVRDIVRTQPTLRIFASGRVSSQILTFVDAHVGHLAADDLKLADLHVGANLLARVKGGAVSIYKVTGRTCGRVLLAEVG
jgi:hypothetical protein